MTLPRLLLGAGPEAMTFDRHLRTHGELPNASRVPGSGLPSPLLGEVSASGLGGRGGGGFPLAAKLAAIRQGKGTPVVVVNGTEGEPMSVKDRMLLDSLPHLVLDGALSLAAVLRTADLLVAIDEGFGEAAQSVGQALRDRPDVRRRDPPRVVRIPSGYVSGQETAIVHFVNEGIALPATQPPRIGERGIGGRPTLVSNPETLAQVALIARHGADWYRQLGSAEQPGTLLVTVSGGVRAPGVYEIEYGTHLSSLLQAADGLTEPARAFLFGGYAGSWVAADTAARLRLSDAALRPVRASLGNGVVVVVPQSACPVSEVARVASWMSDQGAGQCGPCVNGLWSIADTLARLREGDARRDAFGDIRRWCEVVVGRGACAHPDGAARFVTSALSVFAAEFDDHARYGLCDACERRPVLITPRDASAVR